MTAAIARLLNVRSEEKWLVARLFWMQFFQGAGVAFFFTTAYATFLHDHEVSDLSFVYIYTSAALWLTGFIYSKLEHRFHVADFSRYIIWFMAISILLIRVLGYDFKLAGFDYFVLIWFNVLYLLSSMEFWGIAALVFEVRQSKRLFSVISAGDIPAKFIGYTLASFTVSYIGTANLLIPSFICMLASLPFLKSIVKAGTLHSGEHIVSPHTHTPQEKKVRLRSFIEKFTSNKLIFWLAILAFLMSVCMVITNFSFYSKIKEAYHSDVDLAIFIGAFLAVIRLCALIVKLLLTSRLITSLGVKRSLLFTPVIFAVSVILVIFLHYTAGEHTELYMFGVVCIVLDVLKTAINQPVFLSIMQPLNVHDRLRSHNIVKGIMDPFAYLFSGLFLFELIQIQHGISLTTLSYFLLLFALCWIAAVFSVNTHYYATVLKAITSKFYNRSDLEMDDAGTVALIRKKLLSGSETEIIHILRMIRFRETTILSEDITTQLLQHASDDVKTELLVLQKAGIVHIPIAAIEKIITDDTAATQLKHKAFSLISNHTTDTALLLPYLTHEDAVIQAAALGNLLKQDTAPHFTDAAMALERLLQSTSTTDKITAAHAIGLSANNQFKAILNGLLTDTKKAINTAAIEAAGKWPDAAFIPGIIKQLHTNRPAVHQALLAAGPAAVPAIIENIKSNTASFEERRQLIRICGAIGGAHAKDNLPALFSTLPEHTFTIAQAIHYCSTGEETVNRAHLESAVQRSLTDASTMLRLEEKLYVGKDSETLLENALYIELEEIKQSLLYIFSALYKKSEIEKVRHSFLFNNKEQTANAFELVEIIVPKKFAHDFIILYEKGDISHRVLQLYDKKSAPVNTTADIPVYVLRHNGTSFLDWSRACAAYVLHKSTTAYDKTLLQQYLDADNILLKETANFTLNNVMNNKLLLLEKVLVLKHTAIFSETPEHILADLAPLMQEIEYTAGSLIFREDTVGDSMYIIYQGSVRIHKGDTTLAILSRENDVFGELSLFDAEKRSASATAETDCFLLKIDQLPFYELIETRPEIIKGAVKMLCKRLRAQNERTIALQKAAK